MKLVFLICLLVGISGESWAETLLTKENIAEYYARSSQVQLEGEEPAIAFLKKHLHDDLKVDIDIVSRIIHMPSKNKTVTYNKAQIIKNTRLGYQHGSISDIDNKVLVVDIAKDRKSARVQDNTDTKFRLIQPKTQDGILFDNRQSIFCDAMIELNMDGVIQTKSEKCSVDISMSPVK